MGVNVVAVASRAVLSLDSKAFTAGMSQASGTMTALKRLVSTPLRLGLDASTVTDGLSKVSAALTERISQASKAATEFQGLLKTTATALGNTEIATAASGIKEFTAQMIKAGDEMTALHRKIAGFVSVQNSMMGTTATADGQIRALRTTALETASSFDLVQKAFSQLAPAATSNGIAFDTVHETIRSVIDAGQVMNHSAEDTQRNLKLISQIVGKNRLQMDDLSGAFGQAFPNAVLILSTGLSQLARNSDETRSKLGLLGTDGTVSFTALRQLIQNGTIDGKLFMEAMTAGITQLQGISVPQVTTVTDQLQNAATIMTTNLGSIMSEGGINTALAEGLKSFNDWFNNLTTLTGEESLKIRDSFLITIGSLGNIIITSWNDIADIVRDVVQVSVALINDAIQSFNSLPEGLRKWGLIGALLGGTNITTVIGILGLMKQGANVLDIAKAGVFGDTTKAWEAKNTSELLKAFGSTEAYSKQFGENFYKVAVLGEPGIAGPDTPSTQDRLDIIDREEKIVSERLAMTKKEKEEAEKEKREIEVRLQNIANRGPDKSIINQKISAYEDNINNEVERLSMLKGLRNVVERGEGQGQSATLPLLNVLMGKESWKISPDSLSGFGRFLDPANRKAQLEAKETIKKGKTGTSFDTLTDTERAAFANHILGPFGKASPLMMSGAEAVAHIRQTRQDYLSKFYDFTPNGTIALDDKGQPKLRDWGKRIEEVQNDPDRLKRVGGMTLSDVGNLGDIQALNALLNDPQLRMPVTGSEEQKKALQKEVTALFNELRQNLTGQTIRDGSGKVIDITDRITYVEAELKKRGLLMSSQPPSATPGSQKRQAAVATGPDADEYRYSGQQFTDTLGAYVDYAVAPALALRKGLERAADLLKKGQPNTPELNPWLSTDDLDSDQKQRVANALAGERIALQKQIYQEEAKLKLLQDQSNAPEKLRQQTAQLDTQLALLREKARLQNDPGYRAAQIGLNIQQMDNQAGETRLSAAALGTREGQAAQYGTDSAQEEMGYARMLYEYNLSMEQRLQLKRTEGIRSFVDSFSSGVASIITGQEAIGAGFAKIIGNMARMLADFFAKWMVQQAALGILGWLGFNTGTSPAGTGTGGTITVPASTSPAIEIASIGAYAPTFHSGGIIGAGRAAGRVFPLSALAGAMRVKGGGLVSGEVPIVAKRGEAVFTPEQMENADRLLQSSVKEGNNSSVNQTVNVTVNGTGGTQEQNTDLANQIGTRVRSELRALMAEEMRQQMRPGGLLRGGY